MRLCSLSLKEFESSNLSNIPKANNGGRQTKGPLATSNSRLLISDFNSHPKGVRMKNHFIGYLLLASALVIVFAAVAGSGRNSTDIPAPPAIGVVIDDFKLRDADGKEHSLKSLAGSKGAVILFIATKCPVSNAYNDRMEKLAQDYKAKGINVIGINANNTEPASEVKSHAADKGLTFVILKDDGNKIADRLGATRTPEAYVLDASMKLVYHGRIDNSQRAEGISSNDLRDALDELLAGKAVTKTGGAAFGCSIKRVAS